MYENQSEALEIMCDCTFYPVGRVLELDFKLKFTSMGSFMLNKNYWISDSKITASSELSSAPDIDTFRIEYIFKSVFTEQLHTAPSYIFLLQTVQPE